MQPVNRPSADERMVDLGYRRAGVFTFSEARAAGITKATIRRRIASGFVNRAHAGVYQVVSMRTPDSPVIAALAACPGAAVSRQSAARIHGFAVPGFDVHLSVTKGVHRKLAGVSVHETRLLQVADLTRARGMVVTTPARTLVDLAAVLRPKVFANLLDNQLTASCPEIDDFLACFNALARRGLTGTTLIRLQLLELQGFSERAGRDPAAASELEHRVDKMLRQAGLVLRRQYRVPWYEGREGVVDFADPQSRTVVEADGRRWHSSQQAMADDRRRDRVAVANGWVVIRVTWQEVVRRPDETAAEILSLLAARRADSAAQRGSGVSQGT